MASKTFYVDGGNFTLSSSFTAYSCRDTDNSTRQYYTHHGGSDSLKYFYYGYAIPYGSTIHSANVYYDVSTGTYGGSAGPGSGAGAPVDLNGQGWSHITFTWRTNTGGGYPSIPGTKGTCNSTKRTGTATFSNVRVVVNYTLPYSKVNPPTTVTVPTNVLPSTNHTLSWSGASGGNSTSVSGYQVYRASTENSNYVAFGSQTTSTSMTVTSHATVGSSYHYRVVAISNVSGYNSDMSSATATMKSYVTAVGVPTAVSVSATNVAPNTNHTLSWSGAAAGTNNAITGYEVYRSETSNGTYTKLGSKINTSSTSGSMTVTAHPTPNSAYYYKVKTIGTISGFDATNPSTVYATLSSQVSTCLAPTSFSSTPSLYESTLTVSWSGQAAGTNNPIASYNIEYQVSNDGSTWGVANSTTSSTTSKALNTSSMEEGYYLRFRVQSIGTIAGYDSGWSAYSSSYRKNRKPLAPTIVYPVNGSTTYTTTPYFKVVVAAEPDGQAQTIQYKVGSGSYITATTVPSSGGTRIFQMPVLSAGSQTITVRVGDATGGISSEESRTITVNTTPFTDATLTTATPIKAIHLNEIRARATNMLAYYGLPAVIWADTITARITPIKAQHITELQNALKSCATAAGTTKSFSTTMKNVRIAKTHIEQMRVGTTQL